MHLGSKKIAQNAYHINKHTKPTTFLKTQAMAVKPGVSEGLGGDHSAFSTHDEGMAATASQNYNSTREGHQGLHSIGMKSLNSLDAQNMLVNQGIGNKQFARTKNNFFHNIQ